jgi:hypothetical protein
MLCEYRSIRQMLEVRPDYAAFRAFLVEHAPRLRRAVRLVVGDGCDQVSVGGRRIDLGRRRVPREVLRVLLDVRAALRASVAVTEIVARVWPGQRLLPEAAADRVYAAIGWLRRAGLGDVLVSRGDGYALAPEVEIDAAE